MNILFLESFFLESRLSCCFIAVLTLQKWGILFCFVHFCVGLSKVDVTQLLSYTQVICNDEVLKQKLLSSRFKGVWLELMSQASKQSTTRIHFKPEWHLCFFLSSPSTFDYATIGYFISNVLLLYFTWCCSSLICTFLSLSLQATVELQLNSKGASQGLQEILGTPWPSKHLQKLQLGR